MASRLHRMARSRRPGGAAAALVLVLLCATSVARSQDCDELPEVLLGWGGTIYHSNRISGTTNPEEVAFLNMDDDLPRGIIERLTCLRHLDKLTLSGQTFRGYDPLVTIGNLTFLTKLALCDSDLTSTNFEHLAELPRLRELRLTNSRLPPGWASRLATGARNLRELRVTNTNTGDIDLVALGGLPYLQILDLGSTNITCEVDFPPGSFPMLRELRVNNCRITDQGWAKLLQATDLAEVDVAGTKITGGALPFRTNPRDGQDCAGAMAAIRPIALLEPRDAMSPSQVSAIGFRESAGDEDVADALRFLPCFARTKSVDVCDRGSLRVDLFLAVSQNRLIEFLDLRRIDLSASHVVHLRHLTRLTWLQLIGVRLPPSELAQLPDAIPSVDTLDLSDTQCDDGLFVALGRCQHLTSLSVCDTRVALARELPDGAFPVLRTLDLSGCPVTDGGVKRLLEKVRVLTLALDRTQVTDGLVDVLARPTSPWTVGLRDTALTKSGVARLREMRPEIDIRYNE